MALGEQPGRDVGGHVGLGASDEWDLAALELPGDPIGGSAGRAECIDLGRVLHHAQRADDVDGATERGAGQQREQLDEEAGPHLVADGDGPGPSGELGGEGGRVLGLVPDPQREHAGLLDDARRLEPGHEQRGLGVPRHDEHGQPFERHGVVAGQVRQVVAERQQEHVDSLLGHRLAHPVEAVEVHRRSHRISTGVAVGATWAAAARAW